MIISVLSSCAEGDDYDILQSDAVADECPPFIVCAGQLAHEALELLVKVRCGTMVALSVFLFLIFKI